jgi:hypothetical protein
MVDASPAIFFSSSWKQRATSSLEEGLVMSKSGSSIKEDTHQARQMTSAQADVPSRGSQRWLELVDKTDPEVEN